MYPLGTLDISKTLMTILGGPSWMDHKFVLRSLWKQHTVEGWRVVIWDYEQSDVLFRVCFWLVAPLSLWKSSTFLFFLYAPGQDHFVLLVFSVKTWYSTEQLNTISKSRRCEGALHGRLSRFFFTASSFVWVFIFCTNLQGHPQLLGFWFKRSGWNFPPNGEGCVSPVSVRCS